jgi:hypothetical protein
LAYIFIGDEMRTVKQIVDEILDKRRSLRMHKLPVTDQTFLVTVSEFKMITDYYWDGLC